MESIYIKLNRTVPMIPLRGMWIMPGVTTTFDVGREPSKKAIEEAKLKDSIIFLSTQKDPTMENLEKDNFNEMGILSKIKQTIKLPDGNYKVMVEGIRRARIVNYIREDSVYEVEIEEYDYQHELNDIKAEAITKSLLQNLRDFSEYKDFSDDLIFKLERIDNFSDLVDDIISYIKPNNNYVVQELINELDVSKRALRVIELIDRESKVIEFQTSLSDKIKTKITENQKEFYLREQLQIIKSELDKLQGVTSDENEDYKEKIEELDISDENKEHLLKEVSRLEYLSNASPESNVIRTYIENVLDIPFGKYSEDKIDISKSRKILDKDHHGLKDVKERVLEYLAVLKLKKNVKGSILCLVGPPGVGKTSIVKSVAESMNREYISMRLGGMSDESEIRGHRKTYIGAMPGRIITLLQKAKTLNPVFLLDEIDKISASYKADPASALLEVLDPNQNNEFLDRYIEIPVDLSNVMFVTTANTTSTIPGPLLDRMEVIELSGYAAYDKLVIAKKYLLPKQIRENGLDTSKVSISDGVLKKVIKNYTRESGVRNLEREIAKICRKSAMRIVEGADKVSVTLKNYLDFLGREKVLDDDIVKTSEVGIVTGLAWTSVGGELLQIEVNAMKGKGNVELTGSLGDVMKESAIAALSYIKSKQKEFNISEDTFKNTDIHVHVPEGATPKDGPSAGITISTGILSALTNKKVRQDVAMTGEVTIRGRVLPIGGLKEKALAAKRYGITNIIIPRQNERDLEDIPENIKKEMKFYPVKTVEEVLKIALEKEDNNENK